MKPFSWNTNILFLFLISSTAISTFEDESGLPDLEHKDQAVFTSYRTKRKKNWKEKTFFKVEIKKWIK